MQIARTVSELYQRWTLWLLSVGLAVIVTLMPYHTFLSTWLGTAIGPLLVFKSWKELLIVLMVLAALGFAALRPKLARTLLTQPLIIGMALYALCLIVLALIRQHEVAPTLAGLSFDLRFIALFVLAQLVVLVWPGLAAKLRRWLTAALLVSTLVLAVVAILQVTVIPSDFLTRFGYDKELTVAPFYTIDQQTSAPRAFAMLSGPNPFGIFLLLPLAVAAVYAARRKYLKLMLPVLALGGIALFLTHSRSAWLGAVVTALVLAMMLFGNKQLGQWGRRYGVLVLIGLLIVGIASLNYAPLRLAVFHSSPGDPTLFEGSTANHFTATARGAFDALSHPLGRGPGQAGPASYYAETPRIAENYYVQIAQEAGLIGLVLFLIILCLTARRLWRAARLPQAPPLVVGLLASFCGIAVVNLLLHGWADDSVALTWWGLAGLALVPVVSRDASG